MTVRIVTDSVSDLPSGIAEELGIAVIPICVRFGSEVYRDGIDLTVEQFYDMLRSTRYLPVTSVPPPAAFSQTYDRLALEADEILVLTVTSKLSGTYEVALQSVALMQEKCRVEVVDSRAALMGQGFLAILAARAARAGADLDEIISMVQQNMPRVDFRASFDTLEYLERGGRIGKAQALLGSLLKINPIIGLKDGVVFPFGKERSRAKAIEHLADFALSFRRIDEMAVEYGTAADDAETLVNLLGDKFPKERIYRARAGAVISTHTGPGLIAVTVLGDK